MSDIEVVELWTYPIKSCGGVQVDESIVRETGLNLDREFMLIDENGKFMTQRQFPELARVNLALKERVLVVSIEGVGEHEIGTDYDSHLPTVETEVHGSPVIGRDRGETDSAIFRDFFGSRVTLLQASREHVRYVEEPYRRHDATNRVAFGDGFPYLLASRASLRGQHEANAMEDGTVPMNRFRPNIVVDGPDIVPFEEDTWKQILIGTFGAYVLRASDRCRIPTIIQIGERAGEEGDIAVKGLFLKSRAGIDAADPSQSKGRFFGQNLNPKTISCGRILSVGEILNVTERGESNVAPRAA